MRIAVTGTNCVGKSTLIEDIKSNWNTYTEPKLDWRKKTKKRHSHKFTEAKQKKILENMITALQSTGRNDNYILDRCPVDNLVYSLWANDQGMVSDDFIVYTMERVKYALTMIDLILFIPITNSAAIDFESVIESKDYDVDQKFIEEIDFLFKSIYNRWDKPTTPYIQFDDKPHVIEVFGTPEQRVEMIKLYITETGGFYGESSIISPDELEELEKLNKEFGLTDKKLPSL